MEISNNEHSGIYQSAITMQEATRKSHRIIVNWKLTVMVEDYYKKNSASAA